MIGYRQPAPVQVNKGPGKASRAKPHLRKLANICRRLPDVEQRTFGDYADFRVRGKVFAYFLNNHHGDGIVSVCCKSQLGENVDRASRDPDKYYLPAYIGARGWFGLRLDRGPADWSEVGNIVEKSYRLAAPRNLVKALDEHSRKRPRATREAKD